MLNNIPPVNTCSKPGITSGIVSPVSDTVDFGSDYTVTCNNGYTASSKWAMNCTADGALDTEHTCDSKPLNYLPLFLLQILAFKLYINTVLCIPSYIYINTVLLVFGDEVICFERNLTSSLVIVSH